MATTRRGRRSPTTPRLTPATGVTRADFDRAVTELRQHSAALDRVRQDLDVQFQRIAQIQVSLDDVRRAWEKVGHPSYERVAQIQADVDAMKKAWDKMKLISNP
jgi:class 3 adenylate cyclase